MARDSRGDWISELGRSVSVSVDFQSVRIWSYCGPHFPAFRLNTSRYGDISLYSVQMRENADQNNLQYGHFSPILRFYMIINQHEILQQNHQ